MAMTRQTFLTRVRNLSDTLNASVDYPDELLKDLASMVHVEEWRKLLDIAPYYRTAVRRVPLSASGTFAWSALTADGETVYRVLEMTDAQGHNVGYGQPEKLRLAQPSTAQNDYRIWTRSGSTIQTFGVSGTVDVLVNTTPIAIGDMASDSDVVDFPDPYVPVLFYETAALVLENGARETGEAQALKMSAEMMRQKMLASLRREAAQAFVFSADDDAFAWGGL